MNLGIYTMGQLALPIQLDDFAVFESFLPAKNAELFQLLKNLKIDNHVFTGIWIWGSASTGKSHLLQAVCERAINDAIFLPIKEVINNPIPLEGLSGRKIVCIDDIDLCAGDKKWELALFELINRLNEQKSCFIASSSFSPRDTGFALKDIESRFSFFTAYKLKHLDDEECRNALKLRAKHRGLTLPDEVLNYLLVRENRDMNNLYQLLDRLDKASLAARRKLTIPFIKKILEKSI